jgi:hypothetical protein
MFPVVFLVAAAPFVLFIGILVRRVRRIQRERDREWGQLDADGIERGLAVLLKRGYDGAVAVLTDTETGMFLQFRKYVGPDEVGLEMHFPRAPWSEPFYDGVQNVLNTFGVSFERVAMGVNQPTVEVIHADFGRRVPIAARVVSEIVLALFRRPHISMQMRADDICPLDQTVETIDHPRPLDLLRTRRLISAREKQNNGPS